MPTDEEKAAAERLRQSLDPKTCGAVYAVGTGHSSSSDRGILAHAYRAEHPADDGERPTLEWAKCAQATADLLAVREYEDIIEVAICMGGWVPITTKSKFRAICKALGIELNETVAT